MNYKVSKKNDYLEFINEELKFMVDEYNTRPLEEFDHLCPADMFQIIHRTFLPDTPLRYQEKISEETLWKIPYFQLFLAFLREVAAAGELKLTTKGNLPVSLVKSLYSLGWVREEYVEKGWLKLRTEEDLPLISSLKILGNLSGLTRKRNNKLALTKKGLEHMKPGRERALFQALFETHFFRFNWGYHDLYPMATELQHTAPFSLYLLLRYGRETRDLDFYTEKTLKAFPDLLENFEGERWGKPEHWFSSCYEVRLLSRLLDWYGFTRSVRSGEFPLKEKISVQATDLFFEVFRLDTGSFRFERPKGEA